MAPRLSSFSRGASSFSSLPLTPIPIRICTLFFYRLYSASGAADIHPSCPLPWGADATLCRRTFDAESAESARAERHGAPLDAHSMVQSAGPRPAASRSPGPRKPCCPRSARGVCMGVPRMTVTWNDQSVRGVSSVSVPWRSDTTRVLSAALRRPLCRPVGTRVNGRYKNLFFLLVFVMLPTCSVLGDRLRRARRSRVCWRSNHAGG